MNINRWMQQVDSMARKDRFSCELRGPANIRSRGLRCTAVSTPSKSMEVERHGFGGAMPTRAYIKGITYENDITFSFMLDSTMEDKQMFELWQSYMYDELYNLQYPDDYHGQVIISQLGVDNQPIYSVELHEAFPTVVGGVSFTAEATEIQKFDVTFAYRTWSSSFQNSPSGLLGGLFNKKMRKITSKLDKKINKKLFG